MTVKSRKVTCGTQGLSTYSTLNKSVEHSVVPLLIEQRIYVHGEIEAYGL